MSVLSTQKPSNKQLNEVASVQSRPRAHWSDPRLLSEYLQLIFNVTIVSGLVYLCVRFVQLIKRDVDRKLQAQAVAASRTVLECKAKYEKNRCQPAFRAPWLEDQCLNWLRCMNRELPESQDFQHSAVVWAETLAEILNGFLKPISVKSLCILLVGTCGIIVVSNVAFKSYRVSYHAVPSGTVMRGQN
ncbi:LANO_0D00628g1_1 [Lachancea nothofagi CBS 11611]|uniref:LANO_0D00628g1_1 n=1 Tax=Lachancea nothofagi CBS 11611 TaxID=1266666 RepID=A0A1G4JCV0_9SACH|nr:LANO_0D00628g1_1 [Lachancea nothofagi CBS 11611]